MLFKRDQTCCHFGWKPPMGWSQMMFVAPLGFFYHKTERNPQMLHGEIPMACFSNHGFQRPLGEHQLAQPRLGSKVEEMLIAFRFYGYFNENP